MPVISYRDALAQGLREALDEDERVFLIGEDIGPYGGAFAVTKGFWEQYGQRRIKDSPFPNRRSSALVSDRRWPGFGPSLK